MNYRTLFLSIVLFVSIFISWWLLSNLSVATPINLKPVNSPDAFMVNARSIHFDKNGDIQSKLTTARITHYPKNDLSELIKPDLILHNNSQYTWHIMANLGTSKNGLQEVVLNQNVILQRFNASRYQDMTIKTTQLNAYPKQNFMSTQQPVTIIQPGSTIHAVGMTANLKTGDIHLLSQARGTYSELKR